MSENIFLKNFPGTPRKSQIHSLEILDRLIHKEKTQFIIVNAPTGSGKSFIAAAIANSAPELSKEITESSDWELFSDLNSKINADNPVNGCFILTMTKQLQDQYEDLFRDIDFKTLKGKTSYECAVEPGKSAETAVCNASLSVRNECIKHRVCPYYNARFDVLRSKVSVLNYDSFFALCKTTNIEDKTPLRKILICDEASSIEDKFVDNLSIKLNEQIFAFLGLDIDLFKFDYKKPYDFICSLSNDLLRYITDHLNFIKDIVGIGDKPELSSENIKKISKKRSQLLVARKIQHKLRDIIHYYHSCRVMWNIVEDKDEKHLVFSPVFIGPYSKDYLSTFEHVIFLSATIINPKLFATILGIEDYEYVELESEFDPTKSPIYCGKDHYLNYNNTVDIVSGPMMKDIKTLCEKHKNEKGIIHTHTFTITNILKQGLRSDRFLFRSEYQINEELIEKHFEEEGPTVLVSPSLTHGVDLKDDFGRFQIIIKLPFLPLREKRISEIAHLSKNGKIDPIWKEYYITKMIMSLIQACGRCTRHMEDHSVTYILDANVIKILSQNKKLLPKHFLDRFV